MRSAGVMAKEDAIIALRLQEQYCDIGNGAPLRVSQNVAMSVEWIREGLKKPGKSQAGLARHLGLDPAAISRLLTGDRQLKANEIEKIKIYLGERNISAEPHEALSLTKSHASTVTQELLEVRGMAEGGPDGWNLWNGEVVQLINRPDNLIGVKGAYGVLVRGTSMSPRYDPNMIAHVHPWQEPTPGDYVVVQRKPLHEGDPPLAVLKRLVRRTARLVILAQLSPAKELEVPTGEIVSIHKIVGSSDA